MINHNIALAVEQKKIGFPVKFEVAESFPLSIAICEVMPSPGCQPSGNTLGRRYAMGNSAAFEKASYLASAEAIERYSIQYNSTRCEFLSPFLTTEHTPRPRRQTDICIGSDRQNSNTSVGSACGETVENAAISAVLELLEHRLWNAISQAEVEVCALDISRMSALISPQQWLVSQLRKLSCYQYTDALGFYVCVCICSDYDGARATIGTAAGISVEKTVERAALESIAFWRNMVMLEKNCMDCSSLDEEESVALMCYRGAKKREENFDVSLKKTSSKPEAEGPVNTKNLVTRLSELAQMHVSLFDLTDPDIQAPVVRACLHG